MVGYNFAPVSKSYASGNVTGQGLGVGGLVGFSYGAISNCWASGTVHGFGDAVGGFCGWLDCLGSTNSIVNCYATGSVTGETNDVGGLVGFKAAKTAIITSHADGVVIGRGLDVGGLVGWQAGGSTLNCSSSGNVTGLTNGVGGLIGWLGSAGETVSVRNCFASGTVTGSGWYVGGVVGTQDPGSVCTISSCAAANGGVSGLSAARVCDYSLAGSLANNIANSAMTISENGITRAAVNDAAGLDGLSRSSAELALQATYTAIGWNFTQTWIMAGSQPVLRLPKYKSDGSVAVMLSNPARGTNSYSFVLWNQPDAQYRVQFSTNLVSWIGVYTNTSASGVESWTDTNAMVAKRFYRLVTP